jgi:hypothetical protein
MGSTKRPHYEQPFDDNIAWTFGNFFQKPWEEVVHEGSTYFPGGQTTVEVGIRLLETGRRNVV